MKLIAITPCHSEKEDRVVEPGETFEEEAAKAKSLIEIGAAKDAKEKDVEPKTASTAKVTGEA